MVGWVASALAADGIDCDACEAWNAPREPFRIVGETFYVGPVGLSVVAIRTSEGVILLDGALPQSVPAITANLAAVGLSIEDVRLIAVSHPHFDHAGGVAALQRASGATVLASPDAARTLRQGSPLPDDPQYGLEDMAFPPVAEVREVADGEVVTLGEVALTAHHTPGHTTGGTTWTWQSCAGDRCWDLVYADSLNAVSRDGFRFSDGAGDALADSIDRVRGLPCDVLVSVHPDQSALFERAATGAFVDPGACRRYARGAAARLRARLRDER